MMDSIQNKNSSEEFKAVFCTNSEAIKAGRYGIKTPTLKCEFCGKELEQLGHYMNMGRFMKTWCSRGEYERCKCEKAIKNWACVDLEIKAKAEEVERIEKELKYKQRLEKMMKMSNLGVRFLNRTFETFKVDNKNKIAFNTCKRYSEKFNEIKKDGIGLMISGNYGSGKTHLAAAIAHELMKDGKQPIFGTLIGLLGKIKASYSDWYSKENEEQIINKYINCELLIIDDLGKEKPTQWVIEKIYYIINCRYENNKPIVITSNYTHDRLMDRLSVNDNSETAEAIVSRLYEMCQGIDTFKCEDYRKKQI